MAAQQSDQRNCGGHSGLAGLHPETLALILELLPGAADRAALRASCQALRAVLDATVDHITVALWRYASAKSDDWGAAPSQLPALLARHPAAAALVLRRAQYMWEVVPSLGGNDIGLRDFSNSVGIAAKEEAAALQELLWEWVVQGVSWPSLTTLEGCPFTCLSPLARLCPNLKSLTAVVYESSAITGAPLGALSRLTALESLRVTAERGEDGQPCRLAYDSAWDSLAAAAPQLKTLQLEFQHAELDVECTKGVLASSSFATRLTGLESLRLMYGGDSGREIEVAACQQLRELVITGLYEAAGDAGVCLHLEETLCEIGKGGGLPALTRLECVSGEESGELDPEELVLGPGLAGCTALVQLRLPAYRLYQPELEAAAAALPLLQEFAALGFEAPTSCGAVFPKLARLSCKTLPGWQLPLARLAPNLTHFHMRHHTDVCAGLLAGHAHLRSLAFDAADLASFTSCFPTLTSLIPVRHLSVLGSIEPEGRGGGGGSVLEAFRALCRVTRGMPPFATRGLSFCSRRDADELVAIAAAEAAPGLDRLEVSYSEMPAYSAMRRMLFAIKSFQGLAEIRIQEGYDDGCGGWVRGRACMRPADLEILCDPKGWPRPPAITLAGVRGVRRADVERLRAAAGGRGPSVVLEPGPEWVL